MGLLQKTKTCVCKLKTLNISCFKRSEKKSESKEYKPTEPSYLKQFVKDLETLSKLPKEDLIITSVFDHLLHGEKSIKSPIAYLHLGSLHHDLSWLWFTNLKSFEMVHALTRILKLLPDKLATAIAINSEHLASAEDDGRFLINLVTELLLFYQNQDKKRKEDLSRQPPQQQPDGRPDEIRQPPPSEPLPPVRLGSTTFSFGYEPPKPELPELVIKGQQHSFESSFSILNDLLEDFKILLKERETSKFLEAANLILVFGDHLMILANLYLDFVHPLLLDIQRKEALSFTNIASWHARVMAKKNGTHRSLTNQFHQILAETEEGKADVQKKKVLRLASMSIHGNW